MSGDDYRTESSAPTDPRKEILRGCGVWGSAKIRIKIFISDRLMWLVVFGGVLFLILTVRLFLLQILQ